MSEIQKFKGTNTNWRSNGLHIMFDGHNGSQGQAFKQNFEIGKEDTEALANASMMSASLDLFKALDDIVDWVKRGDYDPSFLEDAEKAMQKALTLNPNKK